MRRWTPRRFTPSLTRVLWQLLKGVGAAGDPNSDALGTRYAEVLAESLGQPGFRELSWPRQIWMGAAT